MMTTMNLPARPGMTSGLGHVTTYVASHFWALPVTNFTDCGVQYSWFHVIFAIGAMYVAMLLTDWNVVRAGTGPKLPENENDVYIGRSEVAMWMRVVSSWACILLYIWSLVAPVLMPDRWVHPAQSPVLSR